MAETDRKNINLDILDYYDGKIKEYIEDKIGTGENIVHYGTTEYWNTQSTLIGEKSHIYIYTDYSTVESDGKTITIPNIKIGDGAAYLIDNPFITASIEDLMQLHINDNIKHITAEERSVWNGKVRCYLSANNNETVVFTTE